MTSSLADAGRLLLRSGAARTASKLTDRPANKRISRGTHSPATPSRPVTFNGRWHVAQSGSLLLLPFSLSRGGALAEALENFSVDFIPTGSDDVPGHQPTQQPKAGAQATIQANQRGPARQRRELKNLRRGANAEKWATQLLEGNAMPVGVKGDALPRCDPEPADIDRELGDNLVAVALDDGRPLVKGC